MTTSLVLVSDTHLPKRATALATPLWEAIESADVVIHAGDWVDEVTLDEFEARSQTLIAVYGNNDGAELRARLPEIARVEIDAIRCAVIHETGAAHGREKRMDARFDDCDLLVFGHSHIPWDSVTPNGMRLLNPGSPTDRRRQPVCTFMTAIADAGTLRDVALETVDR